ncbi:MAG: hypothetical protein M3131_04330 [Actinomycetota bacterium]|nr:hypothetical protein [Actinomycetota bacterium]
MRDTESTSERLRQLKELGVQLGFYFAKPMDADTLGRLLATPGPLPRGAAELVAPPAAPTRG